MGYAINYQGYYGYGDIQFLRIIKLLRVFITEDADGLKLNRKGHEALLGQHNFSSEINDAIKFGGVNKLDFHFSKKQNKLIKTVSHAN